MCCRFAPHTMSTILYSRCLKIKRAHNSPLRGAVCLQVHNYIRNQTMRIVKRFSTFRLACANNFVFSLYSGRIPLSTFFRILQCNVNPGQKLQCCNKEDSYIPKSGTAAHSASAPIQPCEPLCALGRGWVASVHP